MCARLPLALRVAGELAVARPATRWPTWPPSWRRTGRLDLLHPGAEITTPATAALAGSSVARARDTLRLLARVHLVRPVGDRYTMHDLLRTYAASLTVAQDSDADRRAALDRLLEHDQPDTGGRAGAPVPTTTPAPPAATSW